MERVRDLLITDAAAEKLGRRSISDAEAEQLLGNAYVTVRNPATGEERRLLIGRTDGGRVLYARDRADDRAQCLAGRHRLDGDGTRA